MIPEHGGGGYIKAPCVGKDSKNATSVSLRLGGQTVETLGAGLG